MSERCGNCGRCVCGIGGGSCVETGSAGCWRARAERLEKERDGAVVTVDLLSEQLTWTRRNLDTAIALLRKLNRTHSDQLLSVLVDAALFVKGIDATASDGKGTTP